VRLFAISRALSIKSEEIGQQVQALVFLSKVHHYITVLWFGINVRFFGWDISVLGSALKINEHG
jgi:hypothetical protein